MRVSHLGRQEVRPLDFWVAVVGVVFLLGGMGVYFMQSGHVPGIPRWLTAGGLVLVWGRALWDLVSQGRKAFPPFRAVLLVGFSLFLSGDLVPSLGRASWVKDAGSLLLTLGLLWPWIEFGRRRHAPPADVPADEAP